MKSLYGILCILMFGWAPIASQCNDFIVEDNRVSSTQFLKTEFVKIIVRGNYSYYIRFESNDQGVFAVVHSINGGILNPNDEIIFIDREQTRKRFRFVNRGSIVNVHGFAGT